MTTALFDAELPPGYFPDPWFGTQAWCSLPYPLIQGEKDRLIAQSIGPQVIRWAESGPDGDGPDGPGLIHYLTGEPWRFTPGQKRFWILWYAFDPLTGRWLYRSGLKRGAKGTGKDPGAAVWLNGELIGPTHLVKRDGIWVGERHRMPLVQVAANSEAQAKDVLRVANAMLPRRTRDHFGIDCGETRTIVEGGGRHEILTASERTSEGDPATAIALNEALALDTPLPTPTGWTTMGRISPGDLLVGRDGSPVRVAAATEVQYGRRCYRVSFADGTSVVASDGHRWLTKLAVSRERGTVRTTQEIVEAPRRCRIPRAEALHTDDIDLPIDPYVLGLWLGDGDARAPMVTAHSDDVDELVAHIEARGYVTKRCDTRGGARFRVTIPGARQGGLFDVNPIASLRGRLVEFSLLGNKHIPAEYLRAGLKQRIDLLRGLMDSDGCVTSSGFAIFVNDNDLIVDGFIELARSLGQAPRRAWAPDPRSRKGGCHRVTFTPRGLVPVSLGRKAARVREWITEHAEWQTITSIEEVEQVPVRCVSVEADDHLYLAGLGWAVTHNSHHMTASSGGHRTAEVARRNVGKSPRELQARLCEFTNAHTPGSDSVAERTFLAWQAQVSGQTRRTDILYDSIEAPPHLDIYTDEGLREFLRAAYADAPWADLERLAGEVLDPRTSVADTIRFYGNGLAAREDAWTDPRRFDDLARPDIVVHDKDTVALFLDCSKSTDATGLVGCRLDDGHVFTLGMWQRPRGDRGRGWLVPREQVDAAVMAADERYRVTWFGMDPSPARDDTDESLYWMALADKFHRHFRDKVLVWATSGASTGNAVLFDMRLSQRGGAERNRLFTDAAMQTVKDIEDGTLSWDGDAGLRMHVHNARRRANQWGESLGKVTRDSDKLVDLAVCMVGARMGRRIVLNSGALEQASKQTGKRPGQVMGW